MDDTINRWSDHTRIEQEDKGWQVSTTNNGFQFWGIGTTFPTERGAQMVATAIELALTDMPSS